MVQTHPKLLGTGREVGQTQGKDVIFVRNTSRTIADLVIPWVLTLLIYLFIFALGFATGKAEAASITVTKNLPLRPPTISVVAPPTEPLTAIEGFVIDICKRYPNVPPEIVHSVIWHESRYSPSSVNKSSGCVGLMQISTRWHKQRAEKLGVTDLYDPYGNILVGVDYLNDLYQYNGEDWKLALMLYNMDNKKARQLYAQGKTTQYAQNVLSRADELRREAERRGEKERGIIRSGVDT